MILVVLFIGVYANASISSKDETTEIFYCSYQNWIPQLMSKSVRNSDGQVLENKFIGTMEGVSAPASTDRCLAEVKVLEEKKRNALNFRPSVTGVYYCYYQKWTPVLGLELFRNTDGKLLATQD